MYYTHTYILTQGRCIAHSHIVTQGRYITHSHTRGGGVVQRVTAPHALKGSLARFFSLAL